MKKLNICLVSLAVAPDKTDGEAKVIRALFEYLKKQGHKVKLITGKWNVALNHPDIIQVDLIRKRFMWLPHFTIKVVKYLRAHKFDIIHGNSAKATIPIILSNQKKFLTYIHDLGPFETKLTKIPIEKYLIRYIARKATCITTVSNFIKHQFNTFIPTVTQNKIFNLYNGIEDKYKPQPDEAQKLKERLKIKGPVLLYLGRIAPFKGVDHIIEAYYLAKKEIPDLNLVIGGNPDYSMERIYQKWKSKHKDIHFVGFVSDEELPSYYTMSDIFITYSYSSEGFGLTSIEAIACGTPVICSSLTVFKEVLQDNAIFVPPKKPLLLAKEIKRLLKDTNLREKLMIKAQKFIKRYSWDEVGKRLEDVYSKFISIK
jgi:glycosyltransferase involved in cell wall biosynthesis